MCSRINNVRPGGHVPFVSRFEKRKRGELHSLWSIEPVSVNPLDQILLDLVLRGRLINYYIRAQLRRPQVTMSLER